MDTAKKDILRQLQREILQLQGFASLRSHEHTDVGLSFCEHSFPGNRFPTGAIHEFCVSNAENTAASQGFITGILSRLMQNGAPCIWISTQRKIFPPALSAFGAKPEHVIFIDCKNEKQALWVMEEVLTCEGLAGVVAEIQNIDFTASRRLQLAVEQSRVTGFIVRKETLTLNTIACVARWRISTAASDPGDSLPGLGFARWQVELLKVRNGKSGSWCVEWKNFDCKLVQDTRLIHAHPALGKTA